MHEIRELIKGWQMELQAQEGDDVQSRRLLSVETTKQFHRKMSQLLSLYQQASHGVDALISP